MRSKTGCRGNPTSSGVNGLGGGSIRIQRATPHNHALRIIGKDTEHLKQRLSGWRAGVEPLSVQVEIDIFGV